MITSLRFEMPSAAILQATSTDLTDQERKFRFPVALSPSLRTVLIMGVVIRISETVSQDQSFLQQELFDPRSPYTPVENIILRKEDLSSPLYPQSSLKPCPASPSDTASRSHPCHSWLRSLRKIPASDQRPLCPFTRHVWSLDSGCLFGSGTRSKLSIDCKERYSVQRICSAFTVVPPK